MNLKDRTKNMKWIKFIFETVNKFHQQAIYETEENHGEYFWYFKITVLELLNQNWLVLFPLTLGGEG